MRIFKLIGATTMALALTTNGLAKPTNKELKIGIAQEFENLNPIVSQMLATTYIKKMVIRGLVDLDLNAKWVPSLVKKIPSIENGMARFEGEGDKKHVVADWEIKDNAKWGDGTPVTGYDVQFSWKTALSDNVSVGEREVYDQIKEVIVDKKNPKKFSFVYRKAKWDFNQLLTFEIVPKHLEEPVFKKYGSQVSGYDKNTIYVKDPTNKGLYNGPYIVTEIKLGSHVILERNPLFYGKKANIEKIIIKLIPNTGTLEANLRSGNIDMISTLGLAFDQALSFEKKVMKEKLPYNVNFKQGLVYEHIDLNLGKNEILKDQRVRQALVYSINRDDLTKALFEGKQKPALHNVNPIDTWYTDDPKKIKIYKFSRRTAKKLLDKAGWKMSKDGYRYKDGEKLQFVLMTTAGNKLRELVQTYLKDQWKNVGIDIVIKNEPARVYFGETVRKGKYPAMAMYAWISSPENTPRSTFHSSSIPTKKNGYSGQNSGGWVNKEVDKLIEAVDLEFDAAKRAELVHKILGYYTEEVPVIPLYYRSDVSVTPKNLKGYSQTGHQSPATNHIENWNLSAALGH